MTTTETRADVETRPPVGERLAAAGAARDEGMALAEQAADPRVILTVDAVIQAAVDAGRRFSANTIRDRLPVSEEHLVGARVRSFAVRRVDGHPLMVRVGTEPSTLRSTHHAEVKVWLGWDAYQIAYRNQRHP